MIAWLLGWVWWLLLPARKALAIANYRRCFPERDPAELRRGVGELAAQYLGLLAGRRAEIEGLELAAGGGICLAGHFSAWDVALISLGDRAPVSIFVRTPTNRLAAWVLARMRAGSRDLELLTEADGLEAAVGALERGRLVLLVQDQRYNQGIAVDFFGRPALTSPAFGVLAHKTRAPLLGYSQRREGGRYRARLERLDWAIAEDRRRAVAELTAASQRWYEETIRRRPWAWLWLHDRWKGGDKAP